MQQNIRAFNDREDHRPALLLTSWQAFLREQERSEGTIKMYLHAVKHFLAWYEEEEHAPLSSLRDLTPIALRGYRNDLQHEQQKAISTINMRLSALRAWCAWLLDAGYITSDPAARVKLISGETGSNREGLTSTQVNALLRQAAAARDPDRNVAILQTLLQTGIRLSECSALNFGAITFGERSGTLTVRAGKGNKVRSVPLNSSAREALAALVAPRLEAATTKGKAVAAKWPRPGSPAAGQPLFLSQKGGALTTSAIGQMIAELVKAAGEELVPEETTAHTLRHTFAHNYLEEYPGDIVGLATLLGHSSLDTTRLYSQPSTAQLSTREERLKINAYGQEEE